MHGFKTLRGRQITEDQIGTAVELFESGWSGPDISIRLLQRLAGWNMFDADELVDEAYRVYISQER